LAECIPRNKAFAVEVPAHSFGYLVGVSNLDFILCDDRFRTPIAEKIILIPLDTLKLCPFMAMKNGVSVDCGSYEGRIKTTIYNRIDNSFGHYEMMEYGERFNRYSDIKLDLEKLPEGCEIIEA